MNELTDSAKSPAWQRWTDHKRIGMLYGVTGFAFLFTGFLIMLVMRWQLAFPGEPVPILRALVSEDSPAMPGGVLTPEFYNSLGAMHGSIMVFLAVAPLGVGAFGVYLTPLLIGARDMAFPKLSLVGYALYLAAGLVMLTGFFVPGGPARAGWTAYPPLAVIEPMGQTIWLIGVLLLMAANVAAAINMIATVLQCRAPGMGFMRMPIFVWTQFVAAFLLLLAFPPLGAASVLQLMDRVMGTSFFMPSGLVVSGEVMETVGGGSALLWQHLFWFLAHPEVYVLIFPALGIVAEIIANNIRKPLWGYRAMVYAAIFLGVMSFLVWAHHMYLTGMGTAISAIFQATTLIVSVPSIVMITAILLSLWGGSIRFTTPMLFVLAFLPMFAIGGLTGLPLAFAVTNIHLHDTYYVIGHFHYIVAPGTLLAFFGGVQHWFPKVTGRKMSDALAKLHFWPTLILMNGIFFPMFIQGLAGVSRRLYDGGMTYAHAEPVLHWNQFMTYAAFGLAIAQIPFVINVLWSWRRGERADANPWEGTTLEWAAPSPPVRDGNWTEPVTVHRGPYEYSVPGAARDYSPQHEREA